jgi:hypothetical protein
MVCPAVEGEVVIRRLDIVAAIREGLLVRDSDLTVGLVHHSFGDAFTVTPEDTRCEKEGPQ